MPNGEEETGGEPAGRVAVPHLPAAERRKRYCEVELCVSEDEAVAEARRCLRCDLEFTEPV